jgi:hypothetical protein
MRAQNTFEGVRLHVRHFVIILFFVRPLIVREYGTLRDRWES